MQSGGSLGLPVVEPLGVSHRTPAGVNTASAAHLLYKPHDSDLSGGHASEEASALKRARK